MTARALHRFSVSPTAAYIVKADRLTLWSDCAHRLKDAHRHLLTTPWLRRVRQAVWSSSPNACVMSILNIAFYQFAPMAPVAAFERTLTEVCDTHDLKGSIILAYEGINGMVAGSPDGVEALITTMRAERPALEEMPIKRSTSETRPFEHIKIKVKPEIVTMRIPGVDPIATTAPHLAPEVLRDWLRAQEDIVLIDVRNDFEYKVGTFRSALNPHTTSFHEFPDVVRAHVEEWKDKKVVTFCTGGIRCEKATSWMLEEFDFDHLYQLDGGVLNYFERVPDAEQDWEGELFVFDGRVTLNTRLHETDTTLDDIDE